MDELLEILDEVKALITSAKARRPIGEKNEGYQLGYLDALAEVYDILVVYREDSDG